MNADYQQILAQVSDLLVREGVYLDRQDWDAWLDLFLPDAEYWVPSWKAEHEHTNDPKRELSLIYYYSRAGLEDRIWRIRSGQSVASTPVPRTTHMVNNILLEGVGYNRVEVSSNWVTHCFFHKTNATEVFFGSAEHTLVKQGPDWKIARKKALLKNDYIPTMLDIYNI